MTILHKVESTSEKIRSEYFFFFFHHWRSLTGSMLLNHYAILSLRSWWKQAWVILQLHIEQNWISPRQFESCRLRRCTTKTGSLTILQINFYKSSSSTASSSWPTRLQVVSRSEGSLTFLGIKKCFRLPIVMQTSAHRAKTEGLQFFFHTLTPHSRSCQVL